MLSQFQWNQSGRVSGICITGGWGGNINIYNEKAASFHVQKAIIHNSLTLDLVEIPLMCVQVCTQQTVSRNIPYFLGDSTGATTMHQQSSPSINSSLSPCTRTNVCTIMNLLRRRSMLQYTLYNS